MSTFKINEIWLKNLHCMCSRGMNCITGVYIQYSISTVFFTVRHTVQITENPRKDKPKQQYDETTSCLSVSIFLSLFPTLETQQHICFFPTFFVPWHQKAAGTIQVRLSGSFSERLTFRLYPLDQRIEDSF